jgi:hypothetical protein
MADGKASSARARLLVNEDTEEITFYSFGTLNTVISIDGKFPLVEVRTVWLT